MSALPKLSAGGAAFLIFKLTGEQISADTISRLAREKKIPHSVDSTRRKLFESIDIIRFAKARAEEKREAQRLKQRTARAKG